MLEAAGRRVGAVTGRLRETDLVVTLGGDGTFLAGARLAAPRGIPLLGVNLGRLGFLTELEAEQVEDGVSRFINGSYRIEERTILQVTLRRADETWWRSASTSGRDHRRRSYVARLRPTSVGKRSASSTLTGPWSPPRRPTA
jgi:NAD kinase